MASTLAEVGRGANAKAYHSPMEAELALRINEMNLAIICQVITASLRDSAHWLLLPQPWLCLPFGQDATTLPI